MKGEQQGQRYNRVHRRQEARPDSQSGRNGHSSHPRPGHHQLGDSPPPGLCRPGGKGTGGGTSKGELQGASQQLVIIIFVQYWNNFSMCDIRYFVLSLSMEKLRWEQV